MTDRLSSALLLVIDGIAPVFELYAAIATLNAQERAIFDSLNRAFHQRLDRERREVAVIARCEAMVEAAENWAAQQETP